MDVGGTPYLGTRQGHHNNSSPDDALPRPSLLLGSSFYPHQKTQGQADCNPHRVVGLFRLWTRDAGPKQQQRDRISFGGSRRPAGCSSFSEATHPTAAESPCRARIAIYENAGKIPSMGLKIAVRTRGDQGRSKGGLNADDSTHAAMLNTLNVLYRTSKP